MIHPSHRPTVFIAPALVVAAVVVLLCTLLHTSVARGRPRPVRFSPLVAYRLDYQRDILPLIQAKGDDLVGQKMPPLAFDRWLNTDGNRPLDTDGHLTLYRWWTDGCEHCEKTLPAVEALRRKYGPKGLRVVAVYHPKPPGEVSDSVVLAAARRMGYGGAVALDLDWSELKKFYLDTGERPATSASFLVDQQGVIRLVHPGPRFYPSHDPADKRENADYLRVEEAVGILLPQGR